MDTDKLTDDNTPDPAIDPKARAKTALQKAVKSATKPKTKRRGGGESKHSPRRIEAAESTQATALEYRKMGLSYSQIAEKMGLGSPQTAWNAVESALKRVLQEPADDVRRMELARIDALWIKPYGAALGGDTFAINTCLQLMNRRARLLGLDAPVVNHNKSLDPPAPAGVLVVGHTMSPEEWSELAKQQQEKLTTDTAAS